MSGMVLGGKLIIHSPFIAPKHEIATMTAKKTPPKGPKRARPKSKATVLLRATVS